MTSNLCSVARVLRKKDCDAKWLSKGGGRKNVQSLTDDQREILMLRTGIISDLDDICDHHEHYFIKSDKYFVGRAGNRCCDPFSSHKTFRKGNFILGHYVQCLN